MPPKPLPEAIRWHRDVAEAVTLGDAEAAERTMRLIVAEARDAVDPR